MKNLLIFFFIINISFFAKSFAQTSNNIQSDIKLHTFVEEEAVPLNREVVYIVELSWTGELNRYKINKVLEPDITNLTVRGTGSSNKVITNEDGSSKSIKRITFYFKPTEMGMAYINGVTISYEDILLDKKESLIASRIGVKIIDPIPDPKSIIDISDLLLYGFIIIVFGGLIFFLWQYQRKRKIAALEQSAEVIETIEEKYLRLLKETIHISGNNFKEKLHDLTRLLVGYFSEKYNYSLTKMSTPDVLNYLENVELPKDLIEKIKEFFSKSDLIRFAGESITETEFHQLYALVEWILDKYKKEIMEENK